jgi:hypothetical protein
MLLFVSQKYMNFLNIAFQKILKVKLLTPNRLLRKSKTLILKRLKIPYKF